MAIAKTASKKIVVLIRSVKFLSPEVPLYLYTAYVLQSTVYYKYIYITYGLAEDTVVMSGLVLLVAT